MATRHFLIASCILFLLLLRGKSFSSLRLRKSAQSRRCTLSMESYKGRGEHNYEYELLNPQRQEAGSEETSVRYQQSPDENQRAAIDTRDPAVLVVAGPGSGKTRVMAARLAHLLDRGEDSVSPSEILLLSFTYSAAETLRANADKIVTRPASASGVYCDTFHGFCLTVIREHMALIMSSKKSMPTIANDEDQVNIMISVMENKEKRSASAADAKNLLKHIRVWKELGLGYLGVRKKSLVSHTEMRAYDLYSDYQLKLKALSALDFGDLLLYTLRLFRQHPDVLDQYRKKFKHILVDEFQDVSPAQYDILRLLTLGSSLGYATSAPGGIRGRSRTRSAASIVDFAYSLDEKSGDNANYQQQKQPDVFSSALGVQYSSNIDDEEAAAAAAEKAAGEVAAAIEEQQFPQKHIVHVFCAGDDDQSIYAWRGAQIELMRRFRFDFPGAKVLRFDVSYRMPDQICQAAAAIVQNLPGRIGKSLQSSSSMSVSQREHMYDDASSPFAPANAANAAAAASRSVRGGPGETRGSSSSSSNVKSGDNDEGSAALAGTQAAIVVRKMADETQEIDWIVKYLEKRIQETTLYDSQGADNGNNNNFNLAHGQDNSGNYKSETYDDISSNNREQEEVGTLPNALSDYSIVVLARHQSDLKRISDQLKVHNVPFRSRVFSLSWYLPRGGEAPLNFLRLLTIPTDDIAFEAAFDNKIMTSLDLREIKEEILPIIQRAAKKFDTSLLEAARQCSVKNDEFKKHHKIAVDSFFKVYDSSLKQIKQYFRKGSDGKKCLEDILYQAYTHRNSSTPNIRQSIEDLSLKASGFEDLGKFFSQVTVKGDFVFFDEGTSRRSADASHISNTLQGKPTISVWLMVMHAAKGLEFDEVILPFWTSKNIPNPKYNPDDERRLAFVSLTRARERVMISYSSKMLPSGVRSSSGGSKMMSGSESSFLPSPIITELLKTQVPSVVLEDLSISQFLNTKARNQMPIRRSHVPPPPTVILGNKEVVMEFHPLLSKELKDVVNKANYYPNEANTNLASTSELQQQFQEEKAFLPSSPALTRTAEKSAAVVADNITTPPSSPAALIQKAAATTPPTSSKKKTVKKAATSTVASKLPSVAELTISEINRLIHDDSKVLKKDLKLLLREALAARGVKRGTIPVLIKGDEYAPRALSSCSAKELGEYLVSRMTKAEEMNATPIETGDAK